MKRTILWFRNDLRLHDHPALHAALKACDEIVPAFILDERYLQRDRWGFRRTGPYRLQFLLESLEDLRNHLKELGGNLVLRIGLPEREIPAVAAEYDCTAVYASQEYTHEEKKVEEALKKVLPLHLFHASTLYPPEQLPFNMDQLPEVFTAFRKQVERYVRVPFPLETPVKIPVPSLEEGALPSLSGLGYAVPPTDARAVLRFRGGAGAAYERLDDYLWNSHSLSRYKETRNGLVGADYSSKFSPWLANGSISVRAIYHEVEAYEAEVEANDSTYWLKFELLWREYFKFVAMKHGRRIFFPGGIQGKSTSWKDNPGLFRQWAAGKTGDRFVDANMRELLFTGFMSNRGRQNVASYLVHQLKQDWRKGAAWFESLLLDYDVASNYGNWMYAAGIGKAPRDRVFNTAKQASMYDGDGVFRALWLEGAGRDPEAFWESFL